MQTGMMPGIVVECFQEVGWQDPKRKKDIYCSTVQLSNGRTGGFASN